VELWLGSKQLHDSKGKKSAGSGGVGSNNAYASLCKKVLGLLDRHDDWATKRLVLSQRTFLAIPNLAQFSRPLLDAYFEVPTRVRSHSHTTTHLCAVARVCVCVCVCVCGGVCVCGDCVAVLASVRRERHGATAGPVERGVPSVLVQNLRAPVRHGQWNAFEGRASARTP
jgi:hypothetical protein